MTRLSEPACAKINLTLRVLGRRADGYHVLSSLVAFAALADRVTFDPGLSRGIAVDGPFGDQIVGANVLERALDLLAAEGFPLGRVTLTKVLPIAAGVGGGSADAAALLRVVRRAYPTLRADVDWHRLALSLGADVPVCLLGQPAWMGGIGDRVVPVQSALPKLNVVLVNPLVTVPPNKTALVFRALSAAAYSEAQESFVAPGVSDRASLLAMMRACGNDLETPAEAVVPALADVRAALCALQGVEHVAVSGAGPTMFGVFANSHAASAAAHALRSFFPSWWVCATTIGTGSC